MVLWSSRWKFPRPILVLSNGSCAVRSFSASVVSPILPDWGFSPAAASGDVVGDSTHGVLCIILRDCSEDFDRCHQRECTTGKSQPLILAKCSMLPAQTFGIFTIQTNRRTVRVSVRHGITLNVIRYYLRLTVTQETLVVLFMVRSSTVMRRRQPSMAK